MGVEGENKPFRFSALAGIHWAILSAAHVALSLAIPRGVAGDALLPFWARWSLVCTELLGIAAAVALAAFPLLALSRWSLRGRPWRRAAAVGLRCFAGSLLALLSALTWSVFGFSGQFLNWEGVGFAIANFAPLAQYAVQMDPFLVYGLPWILIAAVVAASEGLPRLVRRVPSRPVAWGAAALTGTCLVGCLVGEIAQRCASGEIVDPASGVTYTPHDLYRLRRNYHAGPLTHAAMGLLRGSDELEKALPDSGATSVILRPIRQEALPPPQNRWNVVVVLIDSLRSDQLFSGGATRDVMPTLNALSRESVVFTDCYTQASHTDYAVPCVFSSHYPLRARDIHRYPENPTYPRVLIYDLLKRIGYRTALFSSQNEDWGQMSNYLRTGGLDVFFHPKEKGLKGTIDDEVTVTEAIRWIEGAGDTSFFVALNLQSSHLPYAVPESFPRPFGRGNVDLTISAGWFPRDQVAAVLDAYADSLAYIDTQLARLFASLKARGAWDRTVVVVCGDHGEAFYEHGFAAHANTVYEEVMRVPLVIRAPGTAPRLDPRPAQLIDVPPSLCHLLGLPARDAFQGENLFSPDPGGERSRFLLCDTPWNTQLGIVRGKHKLIYDTRLDRCVLYDLEQDPGEKTDVSRERAEVLRDLRTRLAVWRRAQLDYYGNPLRHRVEYPPVLQER